MEDQVPFKVFTFWSDDSKPEVRRFGIDKSVVTSFQYLTAKLHDLFPRLREKTYTVSWKDEDGDDVTVSSDDEMLIALSQVTQGLVKLDIHIKDADSEDVKDEACDFFAAAMSDASAAAAQAGVPLSGMPHVGVMCDACDGPVVGFRYKCATCHDFDLCSRCEAAGEHAEHCMVRVPLPMMPRHLIKAAIKRSRHFLKTVAVNDECPYKKHKREKSGDRKHHRREHHGDRRERRPRGSWLETFATYMNEFANLAGDTDCHPPADTKPQEPNPANTQPQGTNPAETKPAPSTSAEKPGENSNSNGGGANPKTEIHFDKLLNPDNVKYLLDIQKTLTDILIPNLMPQAPKASATLPPTPADVEMGQGDRNESTPVSKEPTPERKESTPESKESTPDKVSVKSESSASSDRETDKADGWTVINKENDLMDMAGKPTPSAPEPIIPIGFNLPEEFQKRVNLGPGQNIYPPLHTATAVLDPIRGPTPPQVQPIPAHPQPTPAQPQPTPTQPQPTPTQPQPAQAQPQPIPAQTLPQPRPRHPKPHIDAAIQQMLAMGFNNDSGWLTQLLETKDGNISAVLDLLTPVSTQRK